MNNRPSVYGIAFGIGMSITGGALAAHVKAGTVIEPSYVYYPALVVTWTGIMLGLAGLGNAFTWGLEQFERVMEIRQPPAPALVTTPTQPTPPTTEDTTDLAWRVALERFFRAGGMAEGFSINKLSGVVGSQSWGKLTDFYLEPQADLLTGKAIGPVLRDAGSNIGTVWNHGWGLDLVMQLIAKGALPHPDIPVPVIELYVRHAAERNAPQKGATQKKARVVDIEPSREVQ